MHQIIKRYCLFIFNKDRSTGKTCLTNTFNKCSQCPKLTAKQILLLSSDSQLGEYVWFHLGS